MSERIGSLSLEQTLGRFASRGPFLLGVDFDGTLAPLVDHPDLAYPEPRAVELLADLARRDGIDVAIVSGRALSDLRERLGEVPGAILVGEHGNDSGEAGIQDPLISEAIALVEEVAQDAGGASVERKPSSVTFHYRNLDEVTADKCLSRIREWADRHEGMRILEGKSVIELTMATRTKGDAIRDLAQGRGVIYIGDDTTDETVFEVLTTNDIGVKVGEGPTAASHQVEDIGGVVRILEAIALASR